MHSLYVGPTLILIKFENIQLKEMTFILNDSYHQYLNLRLVTNVSNWRLHNSNNYEFDLTRDKPLDSSTITNY